MIWFAFKCCINQRKDQIRLKRIAILLKLPKMLIVDNLKTKSTAELIKPRS